MSPATALHWMPVAILAIIAATFVLVLFLIAETFLTILQEVRGDPEAAMAELGESPQDRETRRAYAQLDKRTEAQGKHRTPPEGFRSPVTAETRGGGKAAPLEELMKAAGPYQDDWDRRATAYTRSLRRPQ